MSRIISLDLETGGLDPNVHSVLSVAVIDIESGKYFYDMVPHKSFNVTQESMSINKIDISKKHESHNDMSHFFDDLTRWLLNFNDKIKFLGFNVGSFDVLFLKNLYKQYGYDISDKFDYRSIDLNSIIQVIADFHNIEFGLTKQRIMNLSEDMIYKYNRDIYKLGRHNALYDAWLNVYCYNKCKNILNYTEDLSLK